MSIDSASSNFQAHGRQSVRDIRTDYRWCHSSMKLLEAKTAARESPAPRISAPRDIAPSRGIGQLAKLESHDRSPDAPCGLEYRTGVIAHPGQKMVPRASRGMRLPA